MSTNEFTFRIWLLVLVFLRRLRLTLCPFFQTISTRWLLRNPLALTKLLFSTGLPTCFAATKVLICMPSFTRLHTFKTFFCLLFNRLLSLHRDMIFIRMFHFHGHLLLDRCATGFHVCIMYVFI